MRTFTLRPIRVLAMGFVTALVATTAAKAEEAGDGPSAVMATATIKRCDSAQAIGEATLAERSSAEGVKVVDIRIAIRSGLSEGKHAVHIHETGVCEPCSAARGHFDPGPHGNSSPDGNHPFHAGDLVNIDIDDMEGGVTDDDGTPLGSGALVAVTTRVTLSDGPLSIFDADGSAFIIHNDPDTYCPGGEAAGCAGGGRAACGVIVKGDS